LVSNNAPFKEKKENLAGDLLAGGSVQCTEYMYKVNTKTQEKHGKTSMAKWRSNSCFL
jgi:hypothetical protein